MDLPLDPTLIALVAVPLVLAVVLLVAGRRRRDQSLTPVRLGPRWEPPAGASIPDPVDDERVDVLAERVEVDRAVAGLALVAWDEFLAVLGTLELPTGHRYRVYDPYDPPVVGRDASGRPLVDPARVARDVAQRTGVEEAAALRVLQALVGDDDGLGDPEPGDRAPSPRDAAADGVIGAHEPAVDAPAAHDVAAADASSEDDAKTDTPATDRPEADGRATDAPTSDGRATDDPTHEASVDLFGDRR